MGTPSVEAGRKASGLPPHLRETLAERLVESSMDGILAFDRDCRYVVWNPSMERITGMSREECLGRCAFEVFPFLREIGEDRHFFAALRGEMVVSEEGEYVVPETGRTGYFEAHYAPLRDEEENVVGGFAIVRDVTSRRHALQLAWQREELLRRSQELARLGSVQWDLRTNRLFWSEELRRSLQLTPAFEEQGIERAIEALVHPGDFQRVREVVGRMRHGVPVMYPGVEFRILHPDGDPRYIRAVSSILSDASGRPARAVIVLQDVTGQHAVDEAMMRVSQRFMAIFERAPIGAALISSDFVYKDINTRFETLTGLTLADLVGRDLGTEGAFRLDLIEDLAAEARRNGGSSEREMQVRQRSGRARDFVVAIGEVPGEGRGDLILMLTDITERRAMEEAWRASQEWLQFVLDHLPLHLSWKDRHSVYLGANQAALDRMGLASIVDLIGLTDEALPWTEAETRAIHAHDQKVLDGEAAVLDTLESRHVADGRTRWVFCKRVPLRSQEGVVVGVLVTEEDVTSYVAAEAQLKESEQHYRTFVETISEAIWCLELDAPVSKHGDPCLQARELFARSRFVECNRTFAEGLVGGKMERVLGSPLADLLDYRNGLPELLQAFFQAGCRLENYLFSPLDEAGRQRHFVVNLFTVEEDGVVHRVWGSAVDVTDSMELKRQMVELLETQLQRIGHDLHDGVGQLLTGIRMIGEMVSERLQAEDSPVAQRAERLATLAAQAVQQTRDIYRGLAPVQIRSEGLGTALEELLCQVGETARLTYTLTVDPGTEVRGEERALHLYRIVQEAVHNALRHGKATQVDVSLRREGERCVLQVRDDGRGFDLASAAAEGLGLRSMRYRAAAVGATLSVESAPGEGTTVRCSFSSDAVA